MEEKELWVRVASRQDVEEAVEKEIPGVEVVFCELQKEGVYRTIVRINRA